MCVGVLEPKWDCTSAKMPSAHHDHNAGSQEILANTIDGKRVCRIHPDIPASIPQRQTPQRAGISTVEWARVGCGSWELFHFFEVPPLLGACYTVMKWSLKTTALLQNIGLQVQALKQSLCDAQSQGSGSQHLWHLSEQLKPQDKLYADRRNGQSPFVPVTMKWKWWDSPFHVTSDIAVADCTDPPMHTTANMNWWEQIGEAFGPKPKR